MFINIGKPRLILNYNRYKQIYEFIILDTIADYVR